LIDQKKGLCHHELTPPATCGHQSHIHDGHKLHLVHHEGLQTQQKHNQEALEEFSSQYPQYGHTAEAKVMKKKVKLYLYE
jgi:hypothetical protein